MTTLRGFDHVQLAVPPDGVAAARAFWVDLLGLAEAARPASRRDGAWFEAGPVRVHVAVEDPFTPAALAHPALVAGDLDGLLARCRAAGVRVVPAAPLHGRARAHVFDPFGNRVELVAPEEAAP